MNDQQLLKLRNIIKNSPELIWHTKNYDNLSAESVVEAVLNYGTWENVKTIESILGIKDFGNIFSKLANKSRSNIRPRTANYFSHYFRHHAQ